MALFAQISSYQVSRDERTSARRLLRLHVPVSASGDAADALVYNLSERGLLLESSAHLKEGDVLVVDLPETGATTAEVIWARDGFAGCEFQKPISRAAISAGLLKSPPDGPPYTIVPTQPLGVSWDLRYKASTQPDAPWLRAVTIAGLVLALIAVALFITTLLTVPFSIE